MKTQAVTRRTPIENERREVLEATLGEQYPLLTWDSGRDGVLMTNKNFLKTFAHLKVDEKFKDQKVTIRGVSTIATPPATTTTTSPPVYSNRTIHLIA